MYIPSHLTYFAKSVFQNKYRKVIEDEFSNVIGRFNLTFEDFEKRLNRLEKALFFKTGFIFSYYIKGTGCEKCSHQTQQLGFLTCIAVIESLCGNAKKEKRKIGKKKIPVPLFVTFMQNNLSASEKEGLTSKIIIFKNNKKVKSRFSKFKCLVDMRDGFMHRAELIRIGSISRRRVHHGRAAGTLWMQIDLNNFADLIKISIVRYLLKPRNRRKPYMKHNII